MLGLLLRGAEHAIRLLPRLRLELLCFLLCLVADLGNFFLSAVLLRLVLVIGKLQDLPHPLADFLVGRLTTSGLAGRGELEPEPLDLVKRPGQLLLEVPGLAARAGHELVDLTATVAPHFLLERVFLAQIGKEISLVGHSVTRRGVRQTHMRPTGPVMSQAVARAGSAGILVGWAGPLRLSMPGRGPRGVWLGDNGHDSCPDAPTGATETAEYPVLSNLQSEHPRQHAPRVFALKIGQNRILGRFGCARGCIGTRVMPV